MITFGGAHGPAVPLEAKVESYYKKKKGKPAETVWTAVDHHHFDPVIFGSECGSKLVLELGRRPGDRA